MYVFAHTHLLQIINVYIILIFIFFSFSWVLSVSMCMCVCIKQNKRDIHLFYFIFSIDFVVVFYSACASIWHSNEVNLTHSKWIVHHIFFDDNFHFKIVYFDRKLNGYLSGHAILGVFFFFFFDILFSSSFFFLFIWFSYIQSVFFFLFQDLNTAPTTKYSSTFNSFYFVPFKTFAPFFI